MITASGMGKENSELDSAKFIMELTIINWIKVMVTEISTESSWFQP